MATVNICCDCSTSAAATNPEANQAMNVINTKLAGVLVIEPKVFGDSRGFFFESFNQREFEQATGVQANFVQDNHSRSSQGVLRGLHYQIEQPQSKLVRVVRGAVYDVVVDLRKHSPTFGQWLGLELSEENKRQLWIPAGFAHGFLTLSESADFLYKTTEYYAPQFERCIAWDDSTLGIVWPVDAGLPKVSAKDQVGLLFANAPMFGAA